MIKTKEIKVCDVCKEHETSEQCKTCGKDVCWDCLFRFELGLIYEPDYEKCYLPFKGNILKFCPSCVKKVETKIKDFIKANKW